MLAGIDPLVEAENQKAAEREAKELAKVKAVTFEQAAVAYVALNAAGWSVNNPNRERNVMSGLRSRAFPVFGNKPVGEVNADDVFEALTKDDWLFESQRPRPERSGITSTVFVNGLSIRS